VITKVEREIRRPMRSGIAVSGKMGNSMPTHSRTLAALLSYVMLLTLCAAQSSTAGAPAAAQPLPCTEAQQKQFDFWVGEWDLTWPRNIAGEMAQGSNSVKRTLDGCVVQENFSALDSMPLRGMSVSTFDARSGKWKQTWVDNQGAYLDFVGQFKDGQMTLQRKAMKPDGSRVQQRMIYKNISPNEFDWSWERSLDNGKTWQVLWPIHYKRKA